MWLLIDEILRPAALSGSSLRMTAEAGFAPRACAGIGIFRDAIST
jgi:hypothetical protein